MALTHAHTHKCHDLVFIFLSKYFPAVSLLLSLGLCFYNLSYLFYLYFSCVGAFLGRSESRRNVVCVCVLIQQMCPDVLPSAGFLVCSVKLSLASVTTGKKEWGRKEGTNEPANMAALQAVCVCHTLNKYFNADQECADPSSSGHCQIFI